MDANDKQLGGIQSEDAKVGALAGVLGWMGWLLGSFWVLGASAGGCCGLEGRLGGMVGGSRLGFTCFQPLLLPSRGQYRALGVLQYPLGAAAALEAGAGSPNAVLSASLRGAATWAASCSFVEQLGVPQ